MANQWRIIDLSSFDGGLTTRRGQLVVEPKDAAPTALPWAELAVVLVGDRTKLGASVLHVAAEKDVVIMTTDWRGIPKAASFGWNDHSRVGARQLAQINLTLPRKKNAWMRVVKAKVLGQARVLSLLDRPGAERLKDLALSVRSGDPGNIEAQAARLYWARLFDDFYREPNGLDERNLMLNYGYGVLRGHGIKAVLAAGLLPSVGLFHHGRSNQFNLVDDLIEPFRPVIDFAVASLPSDSSLDDPQVKRLLVSAAANHFDANGYGVPFVLENLAQRLGRYCEGELDKFIVGTWKAPVALLSEV
ncbi:MAG: type II CRISPR-associated endonuclease Cas1 [Propionibacteriaceae bacterium]|jgi:CRISPR-associated protein Cas1|nr:type II CRISPR-associated endonuclease Cas1 [Propionibacteriaceae bacterium]